MGSEVKGAEGGGDALSLGDNIQLNMDDAAKVRANLEAAARVKAMAADETLKFNSEEGAIMNNNNTTKMTNTMGYRDIRQPSSPSRPDDDDDDDDDDDYKAVFNKLPSPCRPDSPVLPPIDYGADRIQNDLLDEICSDIGIKVCFITGRNEVLAKDDMDFDFLDFEVNSAAEPVARNQFDHEGSLDQIIQFGQSQEGPDSQPTSSSTAGYPPATAPYTQGRPPSRTGVPQSPARVTQRQGSQSSDHSNPHLSGTDHLQRMAQLNASIAGSPAKSTLSHASQMTSQSQKIKMEAPGSPKPSMAGTSQSGLMVPSSPSVKQRMSSHIPSTSGASGQYQTPGQMPSGQTHMSKNESGNLSYPPRPPSLHGQPGRTLESPFDHGYFSVGSNAGSGSHDSIESGIPRLTPPPDEQTANDKVLQYLGQQSAQGRVGMSNQGMPGSVGPMQGRPGMQGNMGPRIPGSGAMSHFNAQMPPQQQMPTRHPPDQMFNYRPQHPQSSSMRGMAPYHRGQGPGAGPGGVNFGVRAPQNSFHPPQNGQSQGFNFEHPMSQRYPSPYSNHPNYGQTPVNVAQPKMSADFSGKGYNFQNQSHPGMTPGGPYPNFSSTQSSPDGYERSSMNRAKKQRLDSNAYQGKPQGLQYEPPTTLSQPLVDMKGATMFNPRLPHSGQPPGCPPPGQQMYQGQPPMRGQYPQYNQTQTPHGQQSQFPVRPQGNFGPPTNQMHPGQQMTIMNQGPNAHSGASGGTSMQMGSGCNFGNKSGLSISQSYASLQAQLPPFQPGTQDFVQHLVTDRSSAFRSHPLFPLLRDLVIADMNFHSPTFPFQLISNLPADFNKLLQNYMQRNPASANYRMNEAVDNVIMDALRYAHKAFIEKITQRKRQHGGQGQKSFNAIEEFCERFDKAVKNTLAQNQEAGGTQPHNPGMPPDAGGRLSHCGPPPPGSDGAPNSLTNFGNAPGSTGPPMGNTGPIASNMQNTTQGMYQSSTNSNMPGRPSSASGVQWNAIPATTTGPPNSLPSDMMENQQNCASLPNLTESSVNQSIDLLADIMGGSSSNQSKPPMQNTNTNNANGGGAFGAIMSEQLSSSMPGGLNNIEGNGGYTNSQPGSMNGPAGGMQRHMSVPAATTLLDSGRPTSLPNVTDPPPTPPPDHLLQHTDQSKQQQQMMNMYSNITTTTSSSMPNLAQQVPGVNYPRYLSNNSPSPLDDSMHSTVDADSMYGDHFADIRPSPRKGEGHKKQVLPKEAVAIMLEWLKEHQDKPYPNDDEKDMLIRKTKLTMSQINYWFTNARRRILPKWTLQRLLQEQSASGKMNPITIKQCQQLLGTKSIKSIKEALQKDINLFAESTPSPGSDS